MLMLIPTTAHPVSAASIRYVATTGMDIGDCTNSANPCATITYAMNQSITGDTIHITAGTYHEHYLNLTKYLTFIGAGMDQTIIDGDALNSVFFSNSAIITSISDMTIQNGKANYGGGIYNDGNMTLERVKLTENQAQYGGGLASFNSLTMTDCEVSSNNADLDPSDSNGGGLFLNGGVTNLNRVTINNNYATNYGGGLYNLGSFGNPVNLTNVTISGNTAKHAGGLNQSGGASLTLLNSTISGNNITTGGWTGGVTSWTSIKFKNSIVAGNGSLNCGIGFIDGWSSLGNNLDDDGTCEFTATGDLQNTPPLLSPLRDNGGLTRTMALLAGSPAIDAGATTGCPSTDQRGAIRPQGLSCDIGAYEVEDSPVAFDKSSPIDGATKLSLNLTLSWKTSTNAIQNYYCYKTSYADPCTDWRSAGSSTSAELTNLTPGMTYSWQVKAVNFAYTVYANGSYGATWSFTTAAFPAAFSKINPTSGAVNRPRNLTLSWGASVDADSYEYCIDRTNDNSCGTGWKSVGTNLSAAVTSLTSGTYYWQVQARNTNGPTMANGGTWWSFKVPLNPGSFGKTTPLNNAINRPITLTLYWGASPNAVKYEYCIKKLMSAPCTWKPTGLTRHASPSGLLKNTKYYWQMRAKNAVGTTLANSGTWWNFKTNP